LPVTTLKAGQTGKRNHPGGSFAVNSIERHDPDSGESVFSAIAAGWPDEIGDGCVKLEPGTLLRSSPRSFVLRVRGQSMVGANIYEDDLVVGEFTPEALPGSIVVALIDGESTLKRLIMHRGKPHLTSENPAYPDLTPLEELVIQGVVHTVVRRIR
jgi:SOS-response transcriptional repressor LexA